MTATTPSTPSAGSTLRRLSRQTRLAVRDLIGRYPALASRLLRSGYPLTAETQLVIESFPRSGSMFAISAFLLAQPGHVETAHHVHAPAQVLEAVHRAIPALVVVRPPSEAIPSFCLRYPEVSVDRALRSYVAFHEPLRPVLGRLIVATFAQLISDFGLVIRRVNSFYGTRFVPFQHDEENVRRVFEWIDRGDVRSFGPGETLLRSRARPDPSRDVLKARFQSAYHSSRAVAIRRRAEALYEEFADRASH